MTSKKAISESTEKKLISKFLLNINGKNYSEAHKYLSKILENKLNKRFERIINKI